MRYVITYLFLGPILLAGCGGSAPQHSCGGLALKDEMIGKPISSAGQIPFPKRVILPDGAVTADHNPQRNNIHVDKAGTITDLTCG
jgi:hypothetical protein